MKKESIHYHPVAAAIKIALCGSLLISTSLLAQATPDAAEKKAEDASVEKICSLQNISFLGTTSCTNLCRLLQVESAYCKTPVENILQKYSSCTFT